MTPVPHMTMSQDTRTRRASEPGRSGFTLIELLVVIGIIAILASMLLSGIRSVKQLAEKSACASNMRQMITAWLTYGEENNGLVLQVCGSWSYYSNWSNSPAAGRWWNNLEPYTDTYEVFNCPVSKRLQPQMAVANKTTQSAQGNWTYPRGSADKGGVCLYAYNATDWGRTPDMGAKYGVAAAITRLKLQRMVSTSNANFTAARCPVITDGIWAFDAVNAGQYAYLVNNFQGCYYPHQGITQNTAFSDGHVESNGRSNFILSGVVQVKPQ